MQAKRLCFVHFGRGGGMGGSGRDPRDGDGLPLPSAGMSVSHYQMVVQTRNGPDEAIHAVENCCRMA